MTQPHKHRINTVAPYSYGKGSNFNWDTAEIVFGDPLAALEKKNKAKVSHRTASRNLKREQKAQRDARQDMGKRYGPL
jgi:hypothetical protein